MLLPFTPRFITLTLFTVTSIACLLMIMSGFQYPIALCGLVVSGAFVLLGTRDLMQKRHAILRNYPIAAHLRFMLEAVRPEMRQYFFEDEKSGMPFARDKRAIVYQRAKLQLDKRPFGTSYDVYADGFEWLNHSMSPQEVSSKPMRIEVGDQNGARPYSASLFNISAMSFGALSPNAIRALNRGPKSAASPTTPAKADLAAIIAKARATLFGKSGRAISAHAMPTVPSAVRGSRRPRPMSR